MTGVMGGVTDDGGVGCLNMQDVHLCNDPWKRFNPNS